MTTFAIVDLETTGNAKEDRIIEIGIVITKETGVVIKEFSSLIYPDRGIPPFITSLTGIEEEDVLDAPFFSEIVDEVYHLIKDCYIVAHNIEFDLGFLNDEFKLCGYKPLHNPVIDTVELARILIPTSPTFKLGQLADLLGMGHDRPHRALSDAQVTRDLLIHLLNRLNRLPDRTLFHLLKIEDKLKSELRPFIQKIRDEKRYSLEKEDDYDLLHGIPVKKSKYPQAEKHSKLPPFSEWVDNAYENEEGMKKVVQNYESRSGQREMTELVFNSLDSSKHALIEAGAGTGKSIAYLLASLYYAVQSGQRVLVTTHTTSLQQQLLEEEIPSLEHLFKRPIRTVLYKGRSHYISLIHFSYELDQSQQDNYDIALTKAIILVWLTETATGDVDEIQLPSNGRQFWHKVSAEQSTKTVDLDIGEDSFYHWAQEKASHADLLITNHALFCMDLVSKEPRLPSYDRVIVDEAHHLEPVASRYFGIRMNYKELQRQLSQFSDMFKKSTYRQWVFRESFYREMKKCQATVDEAKEELNQLSKYIFQSIKRESKGDRKKSDVGRIQYALKTEESPGFQSTAREMSRRFTALLFKLITGMDHMREQMRLASNMAEDHSLPILITRLDRQIELCNQIRMQLKDYFGSVAEDHVKWIEIEGEGANNSIYLFSEPLNVADLLREELFHAKESVVLTSATLSTNGSFSYMKELLGIDGENLIESSIPSPYSYDQQVQVMVPNDFPDIKLNPDEYIDAISEAIYSIAEVTKGRMLVLFTSYDMLRKTYSLLKEIIDPEEFMIFAQGVSSGSRDRLKKNFQSFEQSILLGTSSFWEGVDIPGEDLSCLVMVRLPFQPPGQPVQSKRDAQMKEHGRNSFMDRSLPQAIIRFKQGFGRLIRSSTDRGVVFICDHRLMEARYGKYFLNSIPEVPVTYRSTRELINQMEQWL
ncbi:ATP-dependent DNA helicase DinG [Halobacillus sp. K22]|uniref:ATP-dependent DNA helicase DinG n=1 Tax=Halobacillus sp. K22 TaxID=3457431 RepID=UPI003FCC4B68